jgi:hypothetical protein
MRYNRLETRWVQSAPPPEEMEPGVIYVSLEYSTALHLCCCGCREQVVTPLNPAQWTLIFDGEVSLRPSVGSWNNDCRSHYFVDRGRIVEAGPWSSERIAVQRRRDQESRALMFVDSEEAEIPLPLGTPADCPSPAPRPEHWWARLGKWLRR